MIDPHRQTASVRALCLGFAASAFVLAAPLAQGQENYSYSNFGTPGLLDMPTAQSAEDAEMAVSVNAMPNSLRTALTFQITPRLSGTFRYSDIQKYFPGGANNFDRSFDLRYRLIDEGRYRPAIAIGFNDVIGTGIYSSEYIVATKTVAPSVTVTGGLGWGRLGSYNGFSNPLGALDARFKTRPGGFTGTGGQVETGRWFRGDAAFFGGVAWRATDRLTLKAEYSSDAYVPETTRGHFVHKSPINVGLNYRIGKNSTLQAAYLYGDTFSLGLTLLSNPLKPAVHGSTDLAPLPVAVRAPGAARDLGWTAQADGPKILRDNVTTLLANDGLELEGMSIKANSVTVLVRNPTYNARPQAIGRTARILTQTMPASVEEFVIVPMVDGIKASAITLRRSDIEALEHAPDGAWQSYGRAKIGDAARVGDDVVYQDDIHPRLRWSLGPYVSSSYFDPDQPVRVDLGVALAASYEAAPGLVFSGEIRQRVIGNKGTSTRLSNSVIQHVRSDGNLYDKQGDLALTDLTMAYYFQPGKDLYGRVTVGYLERMYGGISSEILWKPAQSRLGLGLEVNYVQQRDFNQRLGFQNYKVATGHVSGYWDMGNGFHTQVDVGRYLAKDWGASVALDRVFANGWRVGAYATFTDVSFNDFGEGSFDKGIRFTVPLESFLGKSTGKKFESTLQPLARDGGAKLKVDGRLYDRVRDYHDPSLRASWGRFWR